MLTYITKLERCVAFALHCAFSARFFVENMAHRRYLNWCVVRFIFHVNMFFKNRHILNRNYLTINIQFVRHGIIDFIDAANKGKFSKFYKKIEIKCDEMTIM